MQSISQFGINLSNLTTWFATLFFLGNACILAIDESTGCSKHFDVSRGHGRRGRRMAIGWQAAPTMPAGWRWGVGTHATRAVGTGQRGDARVGVGGSEQTVNRLEQSRSHPWGTPYAYVGAGSYPCRRASREKRPGAAFSRVLGLSGSRPRLVALPVHARARTVNLLGPSASQTPSRPRRSARPCV